MASYRIYRLKEGLRAQFRQLPHVSGVTKVKVKDYEESGAVEAPTPYAAWFALKDSPEALEVGDVVVEDSGEVRVIKYVGFEPAEWVVPEVKLPFEALKTSERLTSPAAGSSAPPNHA